jgi:hypothetical protein
LDFLERNLSWPTSITSFASFCRPTIQTIIISLQSNEPNPIPGTSY